MTAGLPGTGVGGLFYLLAALLLPARFAWLRARGRSERGHAMLMFRHLAMSVSMIGAVWLTGALLGLWSPLPTIVAVAPIVLTFGTLAVVLGVVEIGRLVIAPPPGFERSRLAPRPAARIAPRDPAREGQVSVPFLDVTARAGRPKSRRIEWVHQLDRDVVIRIRPEREGPPLTIV